MEENNILDLIKNHDSQKALQEMEGLFKNILLNKFSDKESADYNQKSFMQVLDYSIKKFPESYDILTYLRNTYFFDEKTDSEKLYELAYIYENLTQE